MDYWEKYEGVIVFVETVAIGFGGSHINLAQGIMLMRIRKGCNVAQRCTY